MDKIKLKPKTYLYPMPATLVGAMVEGKPNFEAIAYCGIVNHNPPALSVASSKRHYTNKGIRAEKTFSVNIPSSDMVKVTDFCGVTSGAKIDKSQLFDTFFGSLKTAPMIKECPLCLECELIETVVISTMECFIGEIKGVYTEEKFLTDGLPDITKIDPIIFSMHQNEYYRVGKYLAKAYSVGKDYNPLI